MALTTSLIAKAKAAFPSILKYSPTPLDNALVRSPDSFISALYFSEACTILPNNLFIIGMSFTKSADFLNGFDLSNFWLVSRILLKLLEISLEYSNVTASLSACLSSNFSS